MATFIPSLSDAKNTLETVKEHKEYDLGEGALEGIFSTWPNNITLDEIHRKVVALNAIYATRIYDTYSVSTHIHSLQIDDALTEGDPSLVEKIAGKNAGKRYHFLFATKYCAWHQPDQYFIYDQFVDRSLWLSNKQYQYEKFYHKDLKQYEVFSRVLVAFRERFGLCSLSNKQLDKYLWQKGKELTK